MKTGKVLMLKLVRVSAKSNSFHLKEEGEDGSRCDSGAEIREDYADEYS